MEGSHFRIKTKNNFLSVLCVILIIALALLLVFRRSDNRNYLEKSGIVLDPIGDFIMPSALARTYNNSTFKDFSENEVITSNHMIESIHFTDIPEEPDYWLVSIKASTNGNSYFIQEGASTKYMNYIVYSGMEFYDAYTGKMIDLKITNGNDTTSSDMIVEWQGKTYPVSVNLSTSWFYGDYAQKDGNRWESPSTVYITADIKMPKNYDGLLFGYNPIEEISVDTNSAVKHDYYILNKYVPGVSKLFKVEEYSK
ncbi:hypothetical protein IJK16_02370 [Candidatus Saccharibacteria bacterium]|nr:hypothetical protein [Candidatus Saccharibacteria bacterium]